MRHLSAHDLVIAETLLSYFESEMVCDDTTVVEQNGLLDVSYLANKVCCTVELLIHPSKISL